MASYQSTIDAAVHEIRHHWPKRPQAAIILGTGLGELVHQMRPEHTLAYSDLPGFPRSTALSHRGMLCCGEHAGVPVAMMSGRCHRYEGYTADQLALPIHVLQALGARSLIVTNAGGGLNPAFLPGDVMAITGHINLMFQPQRPSGGLMLESSTTMGRTAPGRPIYDTELVDVLERTARAAGFPLRRGVYVAVTGPNYETRAEYRMFRRLGGDAVGMSTVPEALAAAGHQMRVLGMSLITNVARPDAAQRVDAHDVVNVAAAGSLRLQRLIVAALQFSGLASPTSCTR